LAGAPPAPPASIASSACTWVEVSGFGCQTSGFWKSTPCKVTRVSGAGPRVFWKSTPCKVTRVSGARSRVFWGKSFGSSYTGHKDDWSDFTQWFLTSNIWCRAYGLQGYLAHKKQRPPRTLQQQYAWGSMAALGGGAVSCERGTPVDTTQFSNGA